MAQKKWYDLYCQLSIYVSCTVGGIEMHQLMTRMYTNSRENCCSSTRRNNNLPTVRELLFDLIDARNQCVVGHTLRLLDDKFSLLTCSWGGGIRFKLGYVELHIR